jgi:hypothetical protein
MPAKEAGGKRFFFKKIFVLLYIFFISWPGSPPPPPGGPVCGSAVVPFLQKKTGRFNEGHAGASHAPPPPTGQGWPKGVISSFKRGFLPRKKPFLSISFAYGISPVRPVTKEMLPIIAGSGRRGSRDIK